MQNKYRMVLSEVFRDVLMRFSFMFGEECAKNELPINSFDYQHARVGFSGSLYGCIGILSPIELCAEMAANVLGIDIEDDSSHEDSVDTLEELANVVCGQFLIGAFGDKPVFNLTPPLVSEVDRVEWLDIANKDNSLAFMIEDMPTLIYLEVEQEVER